MKFLLSFLSMIFLMIGYSNAASQFSNDGLKMHDFVYDYSVNGGTVGFVSLRGALPSGAQILRVSYKIDTAFTSAGSATVAIGDYDTNTRYLSATAYDNAAFALNNLAACSSGIPFNANSANKGKIGITIGTAALTAGKMHIFVEYLIPKQ